MIISTEVKITQLVCPLKLGLQTVTQMLLRLAMLK